MSTESNKIGGTIEVHEGSTINPKVPLSEVPSVEKHVFKEARMSMVNHLIEADMTKHNQRMKLTVLKLDNFSEDNGTREAFTMTMDERYNIVRCLLNCKDFQKAIVYEYGQLTFFKYPVLGITWCNTVSWVTNFVRKKQLPNRFHMMEWCHNHAHRLKKLNSVCVALDTAELRRREAYPDYGNCIFCYGRGRLNTTCKRDYCRKNNRSRIVMFTNMNGRYINPVLVHYVLYLGYRREQVSSMVHEDRNDSTSVTVRLPIQTNERFSKADKYFNCEYKLLYAVHVYKEDEECNLLHIMNEVATTYEILKEIYTVNKLCGIIMEKAYLSNIRNQDKIENQLFKIVGFIARNMDRPERFYRLMLKDSGQAFLQLCRASIHGKTIEEQQWNDRATEEEIKNSASQQGHEGITNTPNLVSASRSSRVGDVRSREENENRRVVRARTDSL